MPTRCLASPFHSCRPSFAGTAALTAAKRLARTASGKAARRRAKSSTSGGRLGEAETGAAGPESAESAPHSAPPSSGGFRKSLSVQGVTSGGSSPLERTTDDSAPAGGQRPAFPFDDGAGKG